MRAETHRTAPIYAILLLIAPIFISLFDAEQVSAVLRAVWTPLQYSRTSIYSRITQRRVVAVVTLAVVYNTPTALLLSRNIRKPPYGGI